MDAKLILPHSKVIEIFCLSAKTINSLWVSIASLNPSHPRASATIVVLNKFFQRLKKKVKRHLEPVKLLEQWCDSISVSTPVCSLASIMSNSMDCSPPGSFVHGILQARILEWVAMPSSRGSSHIPTEGSNRGLPHCRHFLYHLSLQGSSRIPEY